MGADEVTSAPMAVATAGDDKGIIKVQDADELRLAQMDRPQTGVLFAAGVFEAVGFRIQPSYAGVGEMVSLLPIIGISLSLRIWL